MRFLFSRSWFERLWVVQEIRLANSRTIVKCGSLTIKWSLLLTGLVLTQGNFTVETLLVDLYIVASPYQHVLTLLYRTKWLKCGDKRDKLYAIRGLITCDMSIAVDYTLPVAQVYENFVWTWVNCTGRIDILLFCEMGKDPSRTPTWVPDWSRPKEAVPFWQASLFGGKADAKFCENEVLQVGGILCTHITKFSLACPSDDRDGLSIQNFLFNAWKLLETEVEASKTASYKSGCSLLEAFCCAICGFPSDIKYDPPRFYLSTLESAVGKVLSFLDSLEDGISTAPLTKFWNRVNVYAPGRVIVLTEDGYIGLAPANTMRGDVVYALLGCTSPMVLRPTAGNQFQFVGECYLHRLDISAMFLGPYPDEFQVVVETLFTDGSSTKHRDRATGQLSVVDHRLRELSLYTEEIKPAYRPQITAGDLKKIGVDIQRFDLV